MSLEDRIQENFDRLATSAASREGLPDARYLGLWSYSVSSANDSTFSGRALSSRCPMPDLPSIPNMPGLPGTLLRPAVGSIVGVMFLDADPTQPRCVSWDQTVPVGVGLAGGGAAVHRVGDTGTAGSFAPIPFGGAGLLYTGPGGVSWIAVLTCATPGNPGVWSFTPVTGDPGALTTEAETGSSIVTSG